MYDVHKNRVRFAESDGEYFTYQDEPMSVFLRKIGYDYATMTEPEWDLHVAYVDPDYRAPTRFGDWTVNAVRVQSIGHASMTFEYSAHQRMIGYLSMEQSPTPWSMSPEHRPVSR